MLGFWPSELQAGEVLVSPHNVQVLKDLSAILAQSSGPNSNTTCCCLPSSFLTRDGGLMFSACCPLNFFLPSDPALLILSLSSLCGPSMWVRNRVSASRSLSNALPCVLGKYQRLSFRIDVCVVLIEADDLLSKFINRHHLVPLPLN